jgi:hypothetical protein
MPIIKPTAKVIAKAEKLQVLGLLTLAQSYNEKLREVKDAIVEVLDVEDDALSDYVSDAVYDDSATPGQRLRRMFAGMGITVYVPPPAGNEP